MLPFSAEGFRSHLVDQILPFWINRMVDAERGGFYGRIDGYGVLHKDSPKAIILNARILWTFSAAYRVLQNPQYREMANRAADYIHTYFIDPTHGGVYWEVAANGEVLNHKKQTYAQAFAIYALAEHYRATGDQKSIDLAHSLFSLLESHVHDDNLGGYLEAFSKSWEAIDDVRLSEKDLNATKTMNTHLHVLEAYANLFRATPEKEVGDRLRSLVDLMSERFVRSDGHFNLFFDTHWNLLSDEVSYGHDIEGSWLIHDAIKSLGIRVNDQYKSLINRLMLASVRGLDEDGALMNEGREGAVTDTDKHWWPQAEAMVGMINHWRETGNKIWFERAEHVWKFIQNRIIDDESGEWFWRVTMDGDLIMSEDLAGPWKCPYHNGRAMIELMERLGR